MSSYKKNIIELTNSLPDEIDGLLLVEHLDSFPDVLEETGNILHRAYPKSRLYEMISSEKEEGIFQIVLTEL